MQKDQNLSTHIDADVIADWLQGELGISGPATIKLLAGGRSNLTYLIETPAAKLVLRRPPSGDLPKGAHDVLREADMLQSLGDHVAVPRVLAKCTDPSVIGTPFIIMEFLTGTILRTPADVRELTDEKVRAQAGKSLIDTLVNLHSVDVKQTSLSGLADRRDYLSRQLHRWNENWKHTRTREMPQLAEAHEWLVANAPEQQGSAIVHGDFRLDNCMLDQDGNVIGLLDWELATVGDPMADLGQLMVYWAEPNDEFRALQDPPTLVPGFSTRAELAERYLSATGADPARLEYFTAFNWWKVACILENVYSRMLGGVMGDVDRTPESFGEQARGLAEMALRQVKQIAKGQGL